MAESRLVYSVTYCTGLSLGTGCRNAPYVLSLNNLLCNEYLSTSSAMTALCKTVYGTSSINLSVNYNVMTECADNIICIGVSTTGAGVSGVTLVVAGRKGYNVRIIVTESRLELFTACKTSLCICAVGVLTELVTGCRNNSLCGSNSATGRTMSALCETCLCTGRSYSLIDHLGVTVCLDLFFYGTITFQGNKLNSVFGTGRHLYNFNGIFVTSAIFVVDLPTLAVRKEELKLIISGQCLKILMSNGLSTVLDFDSTVAADISFAIYSIYVSGRCINHTVYNY